jgi:plasmid maintenance system antidote protein VapI
VASVGLEDEAGTAFFGITPGMWMKLQLDYEFMCADHAKGEANRKEVQPCAA